MILVEEPRRQAVESWWASARILMRLRQLQLRRLASDARRDPIALLSFAAIMLAVAVGARRLFDIEPTSILASFVCEALCAALAFAVIFRATKQFEGEGLASGPFHVLLARRGRATAWLLLEAGSVFAGLVAWLTLALLTLDSLRAPAFLAASLVGAGGISTALCFLNNRTEAGAATTDSRGGNAELRSLSGRMLIARLQWRRRVGPIPAWLGAGILALLGGLATALAVRNNPNPAIGAGVLGVTGLVSGTVLASLDVGLLRFAGREPSSLRHLVRDFAVGSPVVVTGGLLMIGTLTGLPLGLALATALDVGVALVVYSTVILLHALGRATRFPTFAAGIDLTIVLVMAVVFTPLALVWTISRGIVLVRAARRLRWRDV